MLILKPNDVIWAIEGSPENLADYARMESCSGLHYLVLAAPPTGHVEAQSAPQTIQGGRAYRFSAPLSPDLSGCHAQIAMVWLDSMDHEMGREAGPITFMEHDLATESVWGQAPLSAKRVALAVRLISDQTTFRKSLGELWVGEPELASSPFIQARPERTGALFDEGDAVSYQVIVSGVPPSVSQITLDWRAVDYEGATQASGSEALHPSDGLAETHLKIGTLAPGYYRLELSASATDLAPASIYRSLGVLAPLGFEPSRDYRIALDAGLSWPSDEDRKNKRALVDASRLAAKCEISRRLGLRALRDRWSWEETQVAPDTFDLARYRQTAEAQTQAGIDVYTVNHSTPTWALVPTDDEPHRHRYPPRDMRNYYQAIRTFLREMEGRIRFFEPWNEPEIFFFQGYVWDLAALCKTAYLSCKDEDPTVGVLWASRCAGPEFWRRALQNGCGPYFEIFNQHAYDEPETIWDLIQEDREMMAEVGVERPVWMSEMGCRTDPDPDGAYLLAERAEVSYLLRSYGLGLVSGIERFFYFYLQEYLEYGIWLWGLLRGDLSPKPSLMALASLIRQVRDARPVGHVRQGQAYLALFERSTGETIALAWAVEPATMKLHIGVQGALYNAMSVKIRDLAQGTLELDLTEQPVFIHGVVAEKLDIVPAPSVPQFTPATEAASEDQHLWLQPIVRPSQSYPDSERMNREKLAVSTRNGATEEIAFWVHNFSERERVVALELDLPEGWRFLNTPPMTLTVGAGESQELRVRLRVGELAPDPHARVVGRLLLDGRSNDQVSVYYQPADQAPG